MKNICFIFCALELFLSGCSSIYTAENFSSKEKFYEDFNKSAKNKAVKITTTNDSSFASPEVSKISNDTLFFVSQIKDEMIRIKHDEIKDIQYYGSDMLNLSAVILLKNGEKLNAENVNLISDSSINASYKKHIYGFLPLRKIKEVSFKNHWLGVPARLAIGTISGFGIGFFVVNGIIGQQNINGQDEDLSIIGGLSAIGLAVGSVWGWIEGYNYTYQFNP
ncbi:MAG: hypothetical protein M1480_14230 [Bacteroidetes bacterium]|nr:hypothetical protein [Bacteroidota bacterium]